MCLEDRFLKKYFTLAKPESVCTLHSQRIMAAQMAVNSGMYFISYTNNV